MFDLAWSEILIIVALAVVILGPKELPQALRAVGRFVRKVRKITGEVQRQFDDVMRETELDELKKEANRIARFDVRQEVTKAVDPDGTMTKSLHIDDPLKETPSPPVAAPPAEAPAVVDTRAEPEAVALEAPQAPKTGA